ncbi:MAG: MFS transporter [Eubacteriaceae bacterium]|nr:MFS transporter [Eubacteriaceae bacterium]
MTAQEQQQVESALGKFTPWLFFLNTFSQQFGILITNQFLNMFMTGYAMMDPVVLAGVMSIGRIIDSSLSFVAGAIVQKANFKTGPYRTWILMNGPLMTIGIFLIFLNPDISPAGKLIVFVIGFLFRNVPQNFLMAAQNVLIRKVAGTSMADRLALTAKGAQGSNAGRIIVNFAGIYVIEFFNSILGTPEQGRGYLVCGVGFVIIQTICQIILYRGLAPYDQYDPDLKKVAGSSVNVKTTHMYVDTIKNPQVWFLMFMSVLRTMCNSTLTPMTIYVFRYSIGNARLQASTNTLASFVGLAAAFVVPPLAKKLGKKNTVIYAGFALTAIYVYMAMMGHENMMTMYIGTMLSQCVTALNQSIGVNNFIDAGEYQLYKTGRDSRPFIMGLNSITLKIGQTLASFTQAWVLTSCGYKSLGGGQAEINAGALVFNLYMLLAGMYAVSSVIMMFYSITEERAVEYANANKKMMEERAAQAGVKATD